MAFFLTDSHPGRGGAITLIIPMEKLTTGSAYSWALVTCLLGVFSLSEWALITGIACTLATFLLNWIYRHKEYRFRTKRDQ
ncbi:hypothetical protein SGGMMB4_01741 [Sodalis glossinidius str. 'morsitans']|uniref:Hypothetical phage protein n=2 Tax=Sodalis glossinidius TaxID=63612 RepID=Q2NV04_SODGM|nr:phage holin family protein [Sodalis glossinidius]BAE74021.1 hypothetical phage protein [Sodalis glossinidius str. 'morsitans']CRL44573.1 hypothetical protein SGGMMB4_01741 [Sodalis glossinidius str. 'morsitans']